LFPITNAAASPMRYTFDQDEYKAVSDELWARGWDLGALYHSHTRTEAYPSPTDVRDAREDVPYVIVSLASEPPVIRAFRIVKENWQAPSGDVEEIPVEVTG
ncbi:MAG TPA: M67 family metallopeptidase, partial [Actinomycetota bacterium]|nr:M67 family metallopeptidase [Actinomycetota bacterium]